MIPLWTFEANWREPITETLQWLTTVSTAHDGSEERRQKRIVPRRSFSFLVTLNRGLDASRLDAWLHRHQLHTSYMPVWTDSRRIRNEGESATVLHVTEAHLRDFGVGRALAIFHADGSHSVGTVDGVDDTSITLSDPMSWAPNDRVFPLRLVKLHNSTRVERITAGVVEFTMVAACVDDSSVEGLPWAIQYMSKDVLSVQPNRITPIEATLLRMSDLIDNQIGSWIHIDHAGRPFVARTHEYTLTNRLQVLDFRRWLHRMAGRVGAAWVPNWQADLHVVATISGNADVIDVMPIDYNNSYAGVAGRTDIMIRLRDRRVFYRRITGAQIMSSDVERLEIDAPLGEDITPEQIAQVCWLDHARIGADEINIVWISAGVANIQLPVRSILEEFIMSFLERKDVDWRNSVLCASPEDIDLSAPGDTIDGVSMTEGDRFLAPAQTDKKERGIYVFHGEASPATRAPDADSTEKVNAGMAGIVMRGATYGRHLFVLDTLDPIELGEKELVFNLYALDAPEPIEYTDGSGINISNGVISAVAAGGGGLSSGSNGMSARRGGGITIENNDLTADFGDGIEWDGGSSTTRKFKVKPGTNITVNASGVHASFSISGSNGVSASGSHVAGNEWRVWATDGAGSNVVNLPSAAVEGSIMCWYNEDKSSLNSPATPATPVESRSSPQDKKWFYEQTGNNKVTFGASHNSDTRLFFVYHERSV